jgi:hypothetical protein
MGFRRFNIYIYDYCSKRGFKQTAQHLMTEAEIPPDAKPPINARQGLLFEYVHTICPLRCVGLLMVSQMVECLLGIVHRKSEWLRV